MEPREPVRSRSHPLVKRLRALRERGRDPGGDLCLLEGVKLVEEALASGAPVVEAALTPAAADHPRVRALVARLGASGAAVRVLDPSVFAALTDAETSQGVLALARRPAADEGAIYRGTPLIVVADRLQNPGNVGALFRTAEAAGATGVYVTEGSADAHSWKALRGSMGSAFRVPHVRGLPLGRVLDGLAARGVKVWLAAADGTPCHAADLRGPTALLFSQEGSGASAESRSRVADHVAVPMEGQVESLNVSVAAAVLLFEARRQRSSP